MPRPPSAPLPPTRQSVRQSARPVGRPATRPSGRIFWLLLIPLVVLTIPGAIFSHSLLTASNKPVTPVNGTGSVGAGPGTSTPSASASAGAGTGLSSLGTVSGSFTIKGPNKPGKGSYVVFVIDGPERFLRTDASSPYSVTLNSRLMKDGEYTITVLTARKGKKSTASTQTVTVDNNGPAATPTATPSATPTSGSSAKALSGNAAQVLALTNQQRATAGCKALSANSDLTKAAQDHSTDMAVHNYFEHNSQNGDTPFDRMKADGYNFQAAAENIAMGQTTPATVMDAWMNSPGHKANILNCTYTDIGIGYAVNSSGTPYWTQDFGKPL